MKKVKRAALYLRVSTGEQTTQNQRLELEAIAKQRGWEIVATYEDNGVSGAKGRHERPQLDAALKDAVRGKFDVLAVWAIDRLGRSLQDLVATLSDLRGAGVDLFVLKQALDTSTASGRMLYQVLGSFAEFERSMIQERVRAGLERAKAQGTRLGRPRVSKKTERAIIKARAEGWGVNRIAKELRCGSGTVRRVLSASAAGQVGHG